MREGRRATFPSGIRVTPRSYTVSVSVSESNRIGRQGRASDTEVTLLFLKPSPKIRYLSGPRKSVVTFDYGLFYFISFRDTLTVDSVLVYSDLGPLWDKEYRERTTSTI